MLNLVYHDTQDKQIYHTISRRLKDKFDIFGGLPDTIEDEWIESVEKLEAMMDQFIHLRQKARDAFELRYKETIDADKNRWELWLPRFGQKGCYREVVRGLVKP